MSVGYGGYMYLTAYDDTLLMYTYCCYNVNLKDYEKYKKMVDGEIVIARDALVEPEIHRKLKRMPSGRKRMVEKRVRRDVPWEELYAGGKIEVKNASGTWCTDSDGIDIMAWKMLYELFNEYQDTGEIPEQMSFFS